MAILDCKIYISVTTIRKHSRIILVIRHLGIHKSDTIERDIHVTTNIIITVYFKNIVTMFVCKFCLAVYKITLMSLLVISSLESKCNELVIYISECTPTFVYFIFTLLDVECSAIIFICENLFAQIRRLILPSRSFKHIVNHLSKRHRISPSQTRLITCTVFCHIVVEVRLELAEVVDLICGSNELLAEMISSRNLFTLVVSHKKTLGVSYTRSN